MVRNRPLTFQEKRKMHENEREVIEFYEKITKNTFMRFEVIYLKKLIKVATPKQINAIIYKMHKQYPQNFTDFLYIVQPVERIFKNRRGGKGTHAGK